MAERSSRTSERARSDAASTFLEFIGQRAYSCVGARSVAARRALRISVLDRMGGRGSTEALCRDFYDFVRETEALDDKLFRSYVAIFLSPSFDTEPAFERALWEQLGRIHEHDARFHAWDPMVSDDPASPRFSFSFGGSAFFVVGLHPSSSRVARRFRWPTLVFNAHAQFEELRRLGWMEPMKKIIRARELSLQGSLNPCVADYGEASEARQYSGRAVSADWVCPFRGGAHADRSED